MTAEPTSITPPRVPFLDPRGFIDRRWYLWLLSLFRTQQKMEGADLGPSPDAIGAVYEMMINAIADATIGLPYPQTDLAPVYSRIAGLESAPVPPLPLAPDDLTPWGMGYVLPAAEGGTGFTSFAVGDLIYASGASTLSKLADVATGSALISGGVTTAPAWGKIGLTTHVSGILPIANGGTNASTASAALANLNGADLSGATFVGTVISPRFEIDAGFSLFINTGEPVINFEANSYLAYSRSGDHLRLVIDSSEVFRWEIDGNILIGAMPTAASATNTLHIADGTAPSAAPTGGGALYVESGALKYRGSAGTITTIAAA